MNEQIVKIFGNRIRVRCCAIIHHEQKILLLNHSGLNKENCYWLPPGGGLETGETITSCVEREVLEETGISCEVNAFIGYHEFYEPPLHALELFFSVKAAKLDVLPGYDPELDADNQLIQRTRWFSENDISEINDRLIHPFLKKSLTF